MVITKQWKKKKKDPLSLSLSVCGWIVLRLHDSPSFFLSIIGNFSNFIYFASIFGLTPLVIPIQLFFSSYGNLINKMVPTYIILYALYALTINNVTILYISLIYICTWVSWKCHTTLFVTPKKKKKKTLYNARQILLRLKIQCRHV